MNRSDVLITGAGPTGLVLALWLSKLGVRVRIIDKASAPGTTSRALAVQARTLERVDALALEGSNLLAACHEDTQFGFILMQRLLGVVAERLQATRLQLLDMYSPAAARAGTTARCRKARRSAARA